MPIDADERGRFVRRALITLASLLVALALAWVAMNLAVVHFAPALWHVELEVVVRDAESGAPIPGARVALVGRDDLEIQPAREVDARGSARFALVHQQQPAWRWPAVGALWLEERIRVDTPDGRSVFASVKDRLEPTPIDADRVEVVVLSARDG